MRNPCTRCLELSFCQEGKYGEPCYRRRLFESYLEAVRRSVAEKTSRLRSKEEGDMVAGDQSKGQI